MKAIRVAQFGGPEVLKLEEIPTPEPGPGEVRIKAEAIGINPVDTYIRSGSNLNLALPYTPGFDAAGTIDKIGLGVSNWQAGARVYCSDTKSGAYAEYVVADATRVHPLPDPISYKEGAAINIPYATAYRALFQKAKALAGETVFIHGASGGVGIAALQWARAAGLIVIGTAGTREGLDLVLKEGAHHALNHKDADYLTELKGLTNNRGADVILEMLANVNLAKDLSIVARNGRIVIIGSRGKIEILPRDAMAREATIYGLMLFNATAAELKEIHAAIYAGLETGTLRPVVGRELPLAKASEGHIQVLEPGAGGKIILTL